MRANHLTGLPGWPAELPSLESFSIGGNPLGGVPPEVTALSRLRHLYLHELALERLRVLDLRGNLLDALGDLPALEKLDLRWNRFADPPRACERLRERGCVVLG